jgi:hypothetical protein
MTTCQRPENVPYEDAGLHVRFIIQHGLPHELLVHVRRQVIIFVQHSNYQRSFIFREEFGSLWIVVHAEERHGCHENRGYTNVRSHFTDLAEKAVPRPSRQNCSRSSKKQNSNTFSFTHNPLPSVEFTNPASRQRGIFLKQSLSPFHLFYGKTGWTRELNVSKTLLIKGTYARRPPKAPAIVAAEKNRATRLACLLLGYHKLM